MIPLGDIISNGLSAVAEFFGQGRGSGRVAADDLNGVSACERPDCQDARHISQADDADVAHDAGLLSAEK